MVAVTVFDERDEFVGIYPDMRSNRHEACKQDFPGMLDVALRFFIPLFLKSKLWGKITIQQRRDDG
jgi:hypothetical protein